jgi:AcrR family transcriptional regulator
MSLSSPIKEDLIQHQILEAAKGLFQTYGLQKVTMDDVAKAVGKGRSSLYYYYKSKDEIFDAVMDIEIKDMLDAIALAVEQAPTAEQKIRAFCVAKLQVLRDKRAFFKTLDMGMDANAISHFKKTQVEHHNRIMKQEGVLLRQIFDAGIEAGELRLIEKKESDMLIFVVLSALHGIKREMAMENSFSKIKSAADAFTSLVMNGLKQ